MCGVIYASANGPVASQARRTLPFTLVSKVRLVGRPSHITEDRGTVSGTVSGTTVVHFVTIGSSSGHATFTINVKGGGTIVGHAVTHGYIAGPTVYFSGTATITGGSGRWAHVSGSSLHYSGIINRQDYHASSTLHGFVTV
jgi:hypothetical protein